MKKISFLCLVLLATPYLAFSQLTTAAIGGNKRASITEWIGLTQITINYNRPGVKGREGKIWGTQVAHYGFQNLGFGTAKESPWRVGANESTTIEFSTDVSVEGQVLKAGKYGLFMALGEEETTVIFSSNTTAWGSFYYNPEEDILRVTVKNQPLSESVEWMKFEFLNQTPQSALIALQWEKRMIPFSVEVDLHSIQLASFANELQTTPGFDFRGYLQAATYCLTNNVALEMGLEWAEASISMPYVGEKNFQTLMVKSQLLEKLGNKTEAEKVSNEALPLGKEQELHQYGRQLLGMKKTEEALKVFEMNYEKNKSSFTTNFGLARGWSAKGDFKKAAKFLEKAVKLAPDEQNKKYAEGLLLKLKENKDIN